jgi:hypothetical protein
MSDPTTETPAQQDGFWEFRTDDAFVVVNVLPGGCTLLTPFAIETWEAHLDRVLASITARREIGPNGRERRVYDVSSIFREAERAARAQGKRRLRVV